MRNGRYLGRIRESHKVRSRHEKQRHFRKNSCIFSRVEFKSCVRKRKKENLFFFSCLLWQTTFDGKYQYSLRESHMKALEIYSFVDHKKHIKREGGSQVEIEEKRAQKFCSTVFQSLLSPHLQKSSLSQTALFPRDAEQS